MCILFVYGNGKPSAGGYKIIFVANRDEFYSRPAAVAAEWEGYKDVFGGIDMEPGREGGTWLAFSGRNRIFKVGALLNITGEPKSHQNLLGRGPIVSNYVTGDLSNEDYSSQLMEHHDHYSCFNLVTVEIKDDEANILHCSNAPPIGKCNWPEEVALCFGNSPPVSSLEKVKHGKELFSKILEKHLHSNDKDSLVNACMQLLKDRTKYWPDKELIKRAPNWAESLSAICVHVANFDYGSRTHTVILVDWQDRMDFYEETMLSNDPSGEWRKTHIFRQL